MFGQSWLIGKAVEWVVTGVTGSPEAGKIAHIATSGFVATVTFDPHGHVLSWADVGGHAVTHVADAASSAADVADAAGSAADAAHSTSASFVQHGGSIHFGHSVYPDLDNTGTSKPPPSTIITHPTSGAKILKPI